MDLTEAEDIKKRWQEYKEELYKKDLSDPDNHDHVITHLEPDIQKCGVEWALRRITTNKASGSDGILVELFQIRKDDAVKVKCCSQYASKFGTLSRGHRTGKVQIHSNPKESQCQKCSNYCTIALILHASSVMLKIFQTKLQQYVNCELPDVQAEFRKGRGTRDQKLSASVGSSRKPESSRKISSSALLAMPKPLTHWKRL